MTYVEEFLKLVKENPDLPIVPMVNFEICGGDYGNWMGSFGRCEIDEFVLSPYDERAIFRSDDDILDTLDDMLSKKEFDALPDTEEECRPYYDALPWEKAIIVYIGTMEYTS